jgi:hypothetical protein
MSKIYFGTDQKKKVFLPDTKDQWFEIQKMNEGNRRQYEEATNNPISMNQTTQEMTMKISLGANRKALIENSVIAYDILWGDEGTKLSNKKENGIWVDSGAWDKVRDEMPSDIAELIVKEINELNPWLVSMQEKKR